MIRRNLMPLRFGAANDVPKHLYISVVTALLLFLRRTAYRTARQVRVESAAGDALAKPARDCARLTHPSPPSPPRRERRAHGARHHGAPRTTLWRRHHAPSGYRHQRIRAAPSLALSRSRPPSRTAQHGTRRERHPFRVLRARDSSNRSILDIPPRPPGAGGESCAWNRSSDLPEHETTETYVSAEHGECVRRSLNRRRILRQHGSVSPLHVADAFQHLEAPCERATGNELRFTLHGVVSVTGSYIA